MSVKNIVASHQTGFLASLLLFQCLEWLGPLFQLCRILCSPCTAVKEIVLCSVGILSKSIMSKSFSGVGIKLGYKEKRWINELIWYVYSQWISSTCNTVRKCGPKSWNICLWMFLSILSFPGNIKYFKDKQEPIGILSTDLMGVKFTKVNQCRTCSLCRSTDSKNNCLLSSSIASASCFRPPIFSCELLVVTLFIRAHKPPESWESNHYEHQNQNST